MPEVARPFGTEARLLFDAGRLRAEPIEVRDARRDPGADVVDAAAGRRRRGEQRLDDVPDEDEVARLVPVAEDLRLAAVAQPVEEDRDDAALERRELPRAVDVRESAGDVARRREAGSTSRGTPRRRASTPRTARAAAARPPRARAARTRRRSRRRST